LFSFAATGATEVYPLSLHDALPISDLRQRPSLPVPGSRPASDSARCFASGSAYGCRLPVMQILAATLPGAPGALLSADRECRSSPLDARGRVAARPAPMR